MSPVSDTVLCQEVRQGHVPSVHHTSEHGTSRARNACKDGLWTSRHTTGAKDS